MSSKKNVKIWTAVDNAKAGFMVTPSASFMVGSKTNFIVADKTGITLAGKGISFGTTSENIRTGGLFVGMNDFVKMIPSTIVTPIPKQIPFPPLALVTNTLKDLPMFLAMLA